MVYDGIITKPDLTEENMLAHWGIKGMKWRKGRKGTRYGGKIKTSAKDFLSKFKSALNAPHYDEMGNSPSSSKPKKDNRKAKGYDDNGNPIYSYTNDIVKRSGSSSSNRPRSRKKNVISGQGSVKKRSR